MSSAIAEGDPVKAVENLVRCLNGWQLTSGIVVASTALIFYDWFLTSADEFDFLWGRRITYTRILFILARYPALAGAIVYLFPLTDTLNEVTTCLSVVTILSSELILAMRAWAIWGRSRAILVFLIVLLIACAVPAIVVVVQDMVTAVVVPTVTLSGVPRCQILVDTIQDAWLVPYIVIMVFEAVVLGLTLYKILRIHQGVPKPWRSTLLDVLWIDGVMYFIFMLLLGILNVGLVLNVSVSLFSIIMENSPANEYSKDPRLRAGGSQLQTVFHSALSTRVALHTAGALKQDIIGWQSTSENYRMSHRMEFANTSEAAADTGTEVRADTEP
ncbi:hypothetical protein BC826DRAFT_1103290 [Russula brevipes]|nr:hypothetical protein BC826DRAFT_1103290 [Russula brevipes]